VVFPSLVRKARGQTAVPQRAAVGA
jgi:hypothetical protein